MSQRLQSIFFFLSALLFALLFFLPLAEYLGETNILKFNVFGIESGIPGGTVPYPKTFSLPVLILAVTAILLSGYLAMGLFRAVKLAQFVKLHKIARIDIIGEPNWQNKGRLLCEPAFSFLNDFVSVKLEYFHVLEGLSIDGHSDEGDLLVKS